MTQRIWIGNEKYFQWAPCPLQGLTVNNVGYSEIFEKLNGSRAVIRSARYSKQYNVSFSGLTTDVDGINVYNRLAGGIYGTAPVLLSDPYSWGTNTAPLGVSAPGLIEVGWKNSWGVQTPTYADVVSNTYALPTRKATFYLPMAYDATPLTDTTIPYIILPFPPGTDMYVSLNAAGSSSESSMFMELWANGASSPAVTVRFNSTSGATGTSTSGFYRADNTAPTWGYKAVNTSGAYAYAKLYLSRKDDIGVTDTTRTFTITSLRTVLIKSGSSAPTIDGWRMGEGHLGLRFSDSAIVEDYKYMYPPRKGISTTLLEVS